MKITRDKDGEISIIGKEGEDIVNFLSPSYIYIELEPGNKCTVTIRIENAEIDVEAMGADVTVVKAAPLSDAELDEVVPDVWCGDCHNGFHSDDIGDREDCPICGGGDLERETKH